MEEALDVYICYYDIDQDANIRKFLVTIDPEEANEYSPHYELANLKQLNNTLLVSNEVWDGCLLHTKDGDCFWYEDEDAEIFEYRKVADNKKEIRLSEPAI